jgi:hypothetical protein
MQPITRGHPVVRQGLLFGLVLGIVDLVRTLFEGPNNLISPAPGALGEDSDTSGSCGLTHYAW